MHAQPLVRVRVGVRVRLRLRPRDRLRPRGCEEARLFAERVEDISDVCDGRDVVVGGEEGVAAPLHTGGRGRRRRQQNRRQRRWQLLHRRQRLRAWVDRVGWVRWRGSDGVVHGGPCHYTDRSQKRHAPLLPTGRV